MEDAAIVALYWARDEQALAETAAKFGAYEAVNYMAKHKYSNFKRLFIK